MTPEQPEKQNECEIRPRDLLLIGLGILPLAIAVTTGPGWAVHGRLLGNFVREKPLQAWPEAWLMFGVDQLGNIGLVGLLLFQSILMGLAMIVISVVGNGIYFERKNAGILAGFLMTISLEWQRWSGIISPDAVAGSLGVIGFSGWLYFRRRQFNFPSVCYLLPVLPLILAGLLSGYWLVVAIPACFDLILTMCDDNMKENQLKLLNLLTLAVAIVAMMIFLPESVGRDQAQPGLERGQIMSGYPDFRISKKIVDQKEDGVFAKVIRWRENFKIDCIRIACEMAGIRPFYSLKHNLFIVLILWPILLFAVAALFLNFKEMMFFPFQMLFLIWLVFIAQAGADWEGRHINQIWPVVVLLATGFQSRLKFRRVVFPSMVILLLCVIGGWLCHAVILAAAGRYLTVNQRSASEMMVVLVGGDPDRDALVAKLFHEGYAPEIWLADESRVPVTDPGSDAGKLVERLVISGVPRDRIQVLPPARNTIEEGDRVAELIAKMKPEERPKSLTVVTTEFHSRRAFLIFGRKLRPFGTKLFIAASDDKLLDPEKWWLDEHTRSIYTQEFAKLFFTWWLTN